LKLILFLFICSTHKAFEYLFEKNISGAAVVDELGMYQEEGMMEWKVRRMTRERL
jgi:hypothetical protein